MAGQIGLFEKTAAGLLIEIDPAEADAKRTGRRISAMHLPIEVLWTAEEEAARDAEEAAALAAQHAAQKAQQDAALAAAEAAKTRAAARLSASQKLAAAGLTAEEIEAVIGQ